MSTDKTQRWFTICPQSWSPLAGKHRDYSIEQIWKVLWTW